jgi:spermidine synthase
VLIGGLGFGYTLRAALGSLRPDATVTVVEIMPEVVSWNRKPDYGLAGVLLDDPRVETILGDVADVVGRRRGFFDAVILDVDNGAAGLTTTENARLYTAPGLARLHASLRPDGLLAIWSAAGDPAFEERLRRSGFAVITERAPLHVGSGSSACLFIGRKEKAAG